jgi:hypothetical protein
MVRNTARKLWAAGAVVGLYFLALTHWGIFTGFVDDDVGMDTDRKASA